MTASATPLGAAIRDSFVAPEGGDHGAYFLSHSIGLQPKAATAIVEETFLGPWARADGKAWDHWLAVIERFRSALAPLIGAQQRDICPQTNVSSALTKILFSLPERARRKKIVLTEDDFPTIGFVAAQMERLGYEIVYLPGGARLADPDAWAPAIADDVQAVLATHVFSNSSVRAPASEICARARARGVFSVIDIAQSAGAVPVDLDGWNADFAIGTSVKYLCGGPGAAFLWVHPETAARCAPIDVGWFSHKTPFAFDIHDFQYAEDSLRFWGGTPSVAPFASAVAGLEVLGAVGMDAVAAHNQARVLQLAGALPVDAIRSHAAPGECGAAILVAVQDLDKAAAALAREGIIHDGREACLRFSAHLYTDESDVKGLAAILADWTQERRRP